MGYEEHRAPGRRRQHVAEQGAAGSGIEMGRGFVEYQQIREIAVWLELIPQPYTESEGLA